MSSSYSVKDLEVAVDSILQNSFDVDSKVCLVTLMKLLDALLQKPGEPKVRKINIHNTAFDQKVGSRKGGIDFLIACGFQQETTAAPILTATGEALLVMRSDESTAHITTARRLLETRAIRDLGMKPDELPKHKQPKMKMATQPLVNAASFDPYVGFRHDGKSAAVGANLGPDSNYISSTETQLRSLQQKQRQLEANQGEVIDREWIALRPGEALPSSRTSPATDISSAKSDGSLLAAHVKKQQQAAHERQHGSLTTKAMRDLEKLKKTKVYQSCLVHFAFPDGQKIVGKFAPSEKIRVCHAELLSCLTTPSCSFDLYVTPPRRMLPLGATLQAEGLVPAAKMFVSFNNGTTPTPGTPYIRPELFRQAHAAPAFPTGHAVRASEKPVTATKRAPNTKTNGKPKRNKEEDLMRRMMGRK